VKPELELEVPGTASGTLHYSYSARKVGEPVVFVRMYIMCIVVSLVNKT
jgi:hypothetical protein